MSKNIKNPLLSGAGRGFPFENFSGSALLMPVTQNDSPVMPDDLGEADSFLGQDLHTNPTLFADSKSNSASVISSVDLFTPRASVSHAEASRFSSVDQTPSALNTAQALHSQQFTPSSTGIVSYGGHQQTRGLSPRPSPSQTPGSRPDASSSPLVGVPLVSSPPSWQPSPVVVSRASPAPPASSLFTGQPLQQPFKPETTSHDSQSNFFHGQPLLRTPSGTPPPFAPTRAQNPPLFLSGQSLLQAQSSTPPPGATGPQAYHPQQPQAPDRHGGQLVLQGPSSWGAATLPESVPAQLGVSPQLTPQPPPPALFHGSSLLRQASSGQSSQLAGPGLPPPTAPPAIPVGPSPNSYRLGSQKKLHYAQPPGLTRSVVPASSQIPLCAPSPPQETSLPPAAAPYTPNNSSLFGAPAFSPRPSPGDSAIMADSPSPVPMVDSPYQSPAHPETGSVPSLLPPSFTSVSPGLSGLMYRQVYHHWFLKTEVEGKVFWNPFSMKDSLALEDAFTSTDISPDTVVATNGGRYDVNILRRERLAVYWDEPPHEVRRCSWFSKSMLESRYIPYEENISTRLEEEYKVAVTTNTWGKRVELPNGEEIVLRGFNDIVHYPNSMMPDAWGGPQPPQRPRTVKRGVDEFHIEEGESDKIDHLLFVVHGIGSVCDLKFRKVEEVVEDFRSLSQQLVQSHFSSSFERGVASRVEVLPVSWHSTLHGEATGIDRKLRNITLRSIPKLRHFTNDTLLDILFYTSPVYCQTIMDTVGNELNRIYEKFLERNPSYEGGVSLVGHSLGSVILFDMLCHQKVRPAELNSDAPADGDDSCSIGAEVIGDEDAVRKVPPEERKLCQRMSYVMGRAGTGQPYITYPQIKFHPSAFFALGSPIAMFVTVRGNEMLGEDFTLPTCPAFFNIFHPFDPVAYRVEALINPESTTLRPLLIPHHKGRKRMHLELKETMTRLGTDLKQRVVESVRSTWNAMYQLAMFHRSDDAMLEEEVNKVLEQQMSEHHEAESSSLTNGDVESDMFLGRLNGGRRIDHVLQEAPLESFNEYVFAMTSHVCYWDSEDTMLLILKELYGSLGISADSITSQPSERPQESSPQPQFDAFSTGFTSSAATTGGLRMPGESYTSPLPSEMSFDSVGRQQVLGMDPTAPPSDNQNVGPPPMSGFVKKT